MKKRMWIERPLALVLVFVMMLGLSPMAVLAQGAPAESHPASAPVTTLNANEDITADFICPNFRAAVQDEIGKTGLPILKGDVEGLDYLYVSYKEITDLAGIEHFTALETLYAIGNELEAIDVSENEFLAYLHVGGNNLTVLDIGSNIALKYLDCSYNQLTEIDVSKNLALEWLHAGGNQFTAIDVSNNKFLTYLHVYDSNLTVLDVGSNTELTVLDCGLNQLTGIDVSKNLALKELYAGGNQLNTIDVSKNILLTHLFVWSSNLTVLDVGNNTALTHLTCEYNKLSDLDLSRNIVLISLTCHNNRLITLDVSNNPDTYWISAESNRLTGVKLNANAVYSSIDVRFNRMTDPSSITGQVLPWDVPVDDGWGYIYTPFAFTPQGADSHNVIFEDWNGNVLSSEYVDSGDYATPPDPLPTRAGFNFIGWKANVEGIWEEFKPGEPIQVINEDYVMTLIAMYAPVSDVPIVVPDVEFLRAIRMELGRGWEDENPVMLSEVVNIMELSVSHRNISSLTGIGYFTSLRQLDCYYNELSGLDVSGNPALRRLECRDNRITALNLTGIAGLEELRCENNRLQSLDLSGNPELMSLYCEANQLTELNLSNNRKLDTVNCAYNRLESLNLSNQPNLNYLYCNNNRLAGLDLSDSTGVQYLHTYRNRMSTDPNVAIKGFDALYQLDMNEYGFRHLPQNTPPTPANITIPDPNFQAAVRNIINKPTGVIQNIDVFDIAYLDVSGMGITSLAGIEHFTLLERLHCADNQLTALNLNANTQLRELNCSDNQLSSLILSANTQLEHLNCSDNQLSSLILSANTQLEHLCCSANNLSSLDLSANTKLRYLDCYSNNLSSLVIGANSMLTDLGCGGNPLTALNLSGATALRYLSFWETGITSLDLSNNTELMYIHIPNNEQLTGVLDVSNNPYLWEINAHANRFTSVKLHPTAEYHYIDIRWNDLGEDDPSKSVTGQVIAWAPEGADMPFQYFPQGRNGGGEWYESATIVYEDWDGHVLDTLSYPNITEGFYLQLPGAFTERPRTNFRFIGWKTFGYGFAEDRIMQPGESIWIEPGFMARVIAMYAPEAGYDIEIDIPDENLRMQIMYAIGRDLGDWWPIDWSKIEPVKLSEVVNIIDFGAAGISDAAGLEYLTSLRSFDLYSSYLAQLDMSAHPALNYLYVSYNRLAGINVRNNTRLHTIDVSNNLLESLDLSQNTEIYSLLCSNNRLTTLDLRNNRELQYLWCYNNRMGADPEVAIQGFGALTNLDKSSPEHFRYNPQHIVPTDTRDISSDFTCPNFRAAVREIAGVSASAPLLKRDIFDITILDVSYMDITSLEGIEHFVFLERLYCDGNQLESIDLSENVWLMELICSYNYLTKLDVSGSLELEMLDVSGNELTDLDVSKNTKLLTLRASWNKLTSIDVSNNTDLFSLAMANNRLTKLDVTKNIRLDWLTVHGNRLTEIDVTKNPELYGLDVSRNRLTSLDLRNNRNLAWLYASHNRLTGLDLRNNREIETLIVHRNVMPTSQTTAIQGLNNLTKLNRNDPENYQFLPQNVLPATNNVIAITDPNFRGIVEDILGISAGATIRQRDVFDIPYLDVAGDEDLADNEKITTLAGIEHFIGLEGLNCSNNLLTSLNLSSNRALEYLGCFNNRLTSLNTSGNTALIYLECDNNELTSLNLSSNRVLEYLSCRYNKLTTLNVSGNSRMLGIDAGGNNLTSVVLSASAPYDFIDLSWNRLPNTSAITGRVLPWDKGEWYEEWQEWYTPFRFSPQAIFNAAISLNRTGTHTFTARAFGYAAQTPLEVTVRNTGNVEMDALTVELSGAGADSFTLSTGSLDGIVMGGTDSFTVVPKTGLDGGIYTATVTVRGTGTVETEDGSLVAVSTDARFNVSFTVSRIAGAALSGAPTVSTSVIPTHNSITVNEAEISGANLGRQTVEYAITTSTSSTMPTGLVWRSIPEGETTLTFTGLNPVTTYRVWARTAQNQNCNAGTAVRSAAIATIRAPGAAVSAGPLVSGTPAFNSITVAAVAIPTNPGKQAVEYAITASDSETMPPDLKWQSGRTFSGLTHFTEYYVWARTAQNASYFAGVAQRSVAIKTALGTFGISLNRLGIHSFGAAAVGYGTRGTVSVTVTNTGNQATGTLTVALSGDDAMTFELVTPESVLQTPSTIAGIAVGKTGSFTIRPKDGLSVGSYRATVTVSGNNEDFGNFSASFDVAFTVNRAAGAAVSGVPKMQSRTHNSITVSALTAPTNPGGQTIEYAISRTTAAPGSGWQSGVTFDNLLPSTGYYVHARTAATGNYNAGAVQRSAIINTLAPPYAISLNRSGTRTLSAATFGYNAAAATQRAESVTVKNTGTAATGILTVALSGKDADRFVLSATSLASITAGNSRSFTVRPGVNLLAGTYTATVTVSGGNVPAQSYNVTFTVNRGAGSTLSAVPTVSTTAPPTHNSITMNVPGISGTNLGEQTVEYAITTSTSTTMPTNLVWQDESKFDELRPTTAYHVWARTAVNNNCNAGTARRSAVITTLTPEHSVELSNGKTILTRTGLHTFSAASFNYSAANATQRALEVTVKNNGTSTQETGELTVSLTGPDASSFMLSAEPGTKSQTLLLDSILTGGTAANAFTVVPEHGLASGMYTATVEVRNEDKLLLGSFDIRFTVNKAAGATINAVPKVASRTPHSITVNAVTSTDPARNPDVQYAITTSASATMPSNLVWQDSSTFTGLKAMTTYRVWARTTASFNYNAGTARSSAAIQTGGITLNRTTLQTFAARTFTNNARSPLSVTITNKGSQPIGPLTIALSGAQAGSFTTSVTTIGSIAGGKTATFTVVPKTGIGVRTHNATVTVSGADGATFSAKFNVRIVVSRGTGSAVSAAPSMGSRTHNSITVKTLKPSGANPGGQAVQYAITTSTATKMPTNLKWQASPTFTGLLRSTKYYVWARTAQNSNCSAGTARRSAVITTLAPANAVTLSRVGTYTFAAAGFNYGAISALSVKVTNAGTNATGALTINLSGADPGSFEIVSPAGTTPARTLASIAKGGNRSFTIRPKQGLAISDTPYTAIVTVSGANGISGSFNVSFKVNKAAGAATSNVPVASKVTSESITVSPVTVPTNPAKQEVRYAISRSNSTTAAALAAMDWQAGTTFDGLLPATTYYVLTRTVENETHNAGAVRCSVAIKTDALSHSISLNRTGTQNFAAAAYGYGTRPSLLVTVSNTGKQSTGDLEITFSGPGFELVSPAAPELDEIAVGGNRSFTIRPVTGLPAGTYIATVTVSGKDGEDVPFSASFDVSFTVNRAAGAVLSGAPVVTARTDNSITVGELTVPTNPGKQEVEYAISTSTATPAAGEWKLIPDSETTYTFTGLDPLTVYYVFARSAQGDNNNAGAVQRTTTFTTAAPEP